MYKTLKKINGQSGFSLIELILYMAILSILLVALFQLLTSIFDVQLESQSTSSVSSDGRFILSRFGYDIGRADSIVAPEVGNQGESLIFSEGAQTYTYALENGNLTLTASPSGESNRLNSFNTQVSDLSFLRLSDNSGELDTVTVVFTLESKVLGRGGSQRQTFKTTVGTR